MKTQQTTCIITLSSLEKELEELIADELIHTHADEQEDQLWELAGMCCPVYTADVLHIAMDSPWVLFTIPERDCTGALDMIQANIFSHLMECGRKYINQ
jgi:hypothetical protein